MPASDPHAHTADRFRACPFKTVTPGGCSRFCCWQQTALSSAQLSSARISSARHALHFAPTRNCWDHHRENLLCYERIILFMSRLNIVKTRFSLLLLEQLQHERRIFLERSVCWECVSSGWFSGAVLLLLRLRTVVTPLSSWLSGSDFKVPVFGCVLENLTRLRAPSWGSVFTWFWCLRVWFQWLSDRSAQSARFQRIRHRESVEMNFGNLFFVTFSAITFASGKTLARFPVARILRCCLQGRRKEAIGESKCHFNLQHFSRCQGDAYYPCAVRWGGLRGGSLRLQYRSG